MLQLGSQNPQNSQADIESYMPSTPSGRQFFRPSGEVGHLFGRPAPKLQLGVCTGRRATAYTPAGAEGAASEAGAGAAAAAGAGEDVSTSEADAGGAGEAAAGSDAGPAR